MGPISLPEWYKMWPTRQVPLLTSPPKGRNYNVKNAHNLSTDSDSLPQQSKKIKTSEKSKSPVKVTDKVSKKVQDKAPEKAQANTSEKAQVTKLASIFTARK